MQTVHIFVLRFYCLGLSVLPYLSIDNLFLFFPVTESPKNTRKQKNRPAKNVGTLRRDTGSLTPTDKERHRLESSSVTLRIDRKDGVCESAPVYFHSKKTTLSSYCECSPMDF